MKIKVDILAVIPIALIFVAIICCGCASDRFKAGHGDAGRFILTQAIARGGRPVSTNSLPVLEVQWRYFQDQYGVLIRLPRDQFPAVEAFLHQTFGEPSIPVDDMKDEGKLGVYDVKSIGAGIQFGYDNGETFINILRPVSSEEMAEHLQKVVEQSQKSR